MDLLRREVPATSLVVAVDPGKAFNRVWLTSGERGLIGEPVSLPVLRDGVDELARLIVASGIAGVPVIRMEATGSLHRACAAEIERRWPGSLQLFAPSETTAALAQLRSRRFKTDDRDCAAMIWLLRQSAVRLAQPYTLETLLCTVLHRLQLVDAQLVAAAATARPTQRAVSCTVFACLPLPFAEALVRPPAKPCSPAPRRSPAAPPSKRSLLARAPAA